MNALETAGVLRQEKRYRELDAAYKYAMTQLAAVAQECSCGMGDFAGESIHDVMYYWLRVAGRPDLIPEWAAERGKFPLT